jgi:transposase
MGSEIIEVVERRRQWPVEVRLKILNEVLQPGASVAAVADRHGVARGLVYQWLRQVREGRMPGLSLKPEAATSFAAVRVAPQARETPPGGSRQATAVVEPPSLPSSLPPPDPARQTAAPARRRSSAIEIRLGNGRVIKVDEGIEPDALARLLAVLDGDRSC